MFSNRYDYTQRNQARAVLPPGCDDVGQWNYELTTLLEMVASLHPTRILELGTYRGGTLYYWLSVLELGGTCYTIDDREPMALWQGWAHGHGVKTVNYQGDTHAPESLAFAKEHAPYDFLFIDANHTEAGVTADFIDYGPLVRPGGLLAFHDILDPHPSRNQDHIRVSALWKRIQRTGYVTRELITNPAQSWGGIGVVLL